MLPRALGCYICFMTPQQFRATLQQEQPPAGLSILLRALWYDARNNWEKAHELVQDETTAEAALLHAYLHRKEGDTWNADYWYRRAGRVRPRVTFEAEWEQLVAEMTGK